MRVALRLAKKGLGRTSPNPCVGAVVVRGGNIIGRGWHKKAGLPHAEVIALNMAGDRARGADLYVTLEPCTHFGRTPPCVDAIIRAGVKRVFIGCKDPNPRVKGKGIRKLERAGIKVASGILKEELLSINEAYEKYITTGLPFVILKLATTLDGKIATKTGESKWITSIDARRYVHRLRSIVDCVMVGSATVIRDNPSLTVRLIKGRNPARAVVDSQLKIPLDSNFFSGGSHVFVFTTKRADKKKIKETEKKGAGVIVVPSAKEGVSLKAVMREFGKREITSVMIEGGARLSAGALKQGVVDKVVFFIAPLIVGGEGVSSVGDLGVMRLEKALKIKDIKTKRVGGDILVEGRPGRGV